MLPKRDREGDIPIKPRKDKRRCTGLHIKHKKGERERFFLIGEKKKREIENDMIER